MLKQVVVDKVMARQLWKLGFREPTLSHYDLNGELQTADGEELILKDYNAPKETRSWSQMLFRPHFVSRPGLASQKEAPGIANL